MQLTLTKIGKLVTECIQAINSHLRLGSMCEAKVAAMPEPGWSPLISASLLPNATRFSSCRWSGSLKLQGNCCLTPTQH